MGNWTDPFAGPCNAISWNKYLLSGIGVGSLRADDQAKTPGPRTRFCPTPKSDDSKDVVVGDEEEDAGQESQAYVLGNGLGAG